MITNPLDQLSPGKKKALHFQSYIEQTERWPKEGKHILAQFDEDSVFNFALSYHQDRCVSSI